MLGGNGASSLVDKVIMMLPLEKTSDRNYWHARLNELLQRQETLRKFQAPMSTMDKDMQALITKLEVISNIWSYVRTNHTLIERARPVSEQDSTD